jgi:hypothetical protein
MDFQAGYQRVSFYLFPRYSPTRKHQGAPALEPDSRGGFAVSYALSCLRTISLIHAGANGDVQPGGVG